MTSTVASKQVAQMMVNAVICDAGLDDTRHRIALLDAALNEKEWLQLAQHLDDVFTNGGPERTHGTFFIFAIVSGRDIESLRRLRKLRISGPLQRVADAVWTHHLTVAAVVFEMTGKWP